MWNRTGVVAAALFVLALPATQAAQTKTAIPTGYQVKTTLALPAGAAAPGYRLQLLTDRTLTPDLDDEAAYDKKQALLRVVHADGTVAQQIPLERSRATLAPTVLRGNQRTYELTVDYSVGAGSYNGPITSWLEVVQGKPRFLSVGGKRISVMDSLKTTWKLVPSPRATGKDILEVACRPSPSMGVDGSDPNHDFQIIYTRYTYTKNGWQRKTATRYGFWENDGTFPPLSRFPR